ncbi:MAG: serine/threonine protein kinase [Verrucomicrobiales bacterium]|nr:serine/threonine protein kinase [Verrucomicrobiales bacterium]
MDRVDQTCSRCGTHLPGMLLGGLCETCLLRFSLGVGEPLPLEDDAAGRSLFEMLDPSLPENARTFGDYELIEEIGAGGMGVVWKARQRSLNRFVAVKMIRAGQLAREEDVRRFYNEAEAAARLQHAGIVAIHEIGDVEGQHFFSMELVEGATLAQLARQTPLPPRRAAMIVERIARIIHYAHGRGVLHRDLKPSNILLEGDDQPRITDFGLAKVLESSADLSRTSSILGSPAYMAPEQAKGDLSKVGHAADIYALGAILYELLTGRPPFQAATAMAMLQKVIDKEPLPLRVVNSAIPLELETICLKCLEKDPLRRYARAEELANELRRFLRDEPITARPVSTFEKGWRWCRRKPVIATLSASVALLLLAFVIGAPIAIYRINQEKNRAEAEAAAKRVQLYVSELKLAEEALTEGNLPLARQLLERQVPARGETNDLRGWEWRYLMGKCRSDELATFCRTAYPIAAMRVAPNGKWLATADRNGNVALFDYAERKQIAFLSAFTQIAPQGSLFERRALAISPDSQMVAVGVGNDVALWNARTFEQGAILRGHSNYVMYLAFSPDGGLLASGGRDGTARLWKLASTTPDVIAVLPGTKMVCSFAFSDDGVLLAFGVGEASVRLWDVSNPSAPRELPSLGGHTGTVHALDFAPGSYTLASAGGNKIVIWELGPDYRPIAERMLRDSRGSQGILDAIGFSPDGQMLASSGSDCNLRLWDLSGANRDPVKFQGHEADVNSVAFSPDNRLISSSHDGTVKLWDISTAWSAKPKMSHGDFIYHIGFSADSKWVASLAQSRDFKLWDTQTEKLIAKRIVSQTTGSFSLSPVTNLLALGEDVIRLLEIPSMAELTNFPGNSPVFTPDGSHLIYFHQQDRAFHYRNLVTHQEKVWRSDWTNVIRIVISPNGKNFAGTGGEHDPRIGLWSIDAFDAGIHLAPHADQVWSLDFSPNGQWLASGSWDGTNRLWDLTRPGLPFTSIAVHVPEAWAVAFSPDSRTLATSGDDSTIKLWHFPSLQQSGTLRGHTATVSVLAFSPDGRYLASGGDGEIRLWHAPSFAELAKESRP